MQLWAMAMAASQIKQPQYSLESSVFFVGLPPETLERIQRRCSWRRYQPRELIIDYLDSSDEVFFVITGNARVTIHSIDGKAVSLRELGPGAMFGEYAAIDGAPRSASVYAQHSCLVASMPAATFRTLLETEPMVAKALIRHLVTEIRELTTRVFEFSTLAVRYRIQTEVLRLARLTPHEGKTASIVPAPTHAELANRISTHREAVTRELSRLSKIGIIEQRKRALLVRDIDRLAAIVHDAVGE